MNLAFIEAIAKSVIGDAIAAAKNPNIQENVNDYVEQITTAICPALLESVKSLGNTVLPLVIMFLFGLSVGVAVVLAALVLGVIA